MNGYGLVPQALSETGRTFRDILSHEATGRVSKAQMGLARTKLGYDLQKEQREVLMNTPNTVENLINSLPVTDVQKQQLMNTPQYEFLDKSKTITTLKELGSAMNRVKEKKAKWAREEKLLKAEQIREDKLLIGERAHEINVAGIKAGAKKGLTPSQEINLRQDIHKEKIRINEAFGKINYKPVRPDKAKKLPEHNKQMRAWTLAQTTNEYKEIKKYYNDVLGEDAGEKINKMAMSAGRKLYRDYSKLKDEAGQEAYLVELRNNSPDLYEVLKSIVRGAMETISPKDTTQGVISEKTSKSAKSKPVEVTGVKDYGLSRRQSLGRSVKSAAIGLSRRLGGSNWPGDVR